MARPVEYNGVMLSSNCIKLVERYKDDEEFHRIAKTGSPKKIKQYTGLYLAGDCPLRKVLDYFGYSVRFYPEVISPVIWDELTAYYCGYFLADGCYESFRKDGSNSRLVVTSVDQDVIVKLRDRISPSRQLTRELLRSGNFIYKLGFTSKPWFDLLQSIGIVRRKSTVISTLKYPPMPFLRDFVRGWFDGDGSIHYNTKFGSIHFNWALCGMKSHLEPLVELIPFHFGVFQREDGLYKIYVTRKEDSIRLFDWLYTGASIYMNRKFLKYKEYLNLR